MNQGQLSPGSQTQRDTLPSSLKSCSVLCAPRFSAVCCKKGLPFRPETLIISSSFLDLRGLPLTCLSALFWGCLWLGFSFSKSYTGAISWTQTTPLGALHSYAITAGPLPGKCYLESLQVLKHGRTDVILLLKVSKHQNQRQTTEKFSFGFLVHFLVHANEQKEKCQHEGNRRLWRLRE